MKFGFVIISVLRTSGIVSDCDEQAPQKMRPQFLKFSKIKEIMCHESFSISPTEININNVAQIYSINYTHYNYQVIFFYGQEFQSG